MTHVTKEFHWVCPKRLLSLRYVQRKPCTYLASRLALSQTDWNQLPLEPCPLGVPSGASKSISEPMVPFAQTVYLSCTNTHTVSKWTKTRFHMTHVTLEFHQVPPKCFLIWFGANHAPILRQYYYYIQTFRNELPLEPHHLGVPSGASKTISKPMVCLAQTVRQSWIDTNIVSK
jgi:hypothetical protein